MVVCESRERARGEKRGRHELGVIAWVLESQHTALMAHTLQVWGAAADEPHPPPTPPGNSNGSAPPRPMPQLRVAATTIWKARFAAPVMVVCASATV